MKSEVRCIILIVKVTIKQHLYWVYLEVTNIKLGSKDKNIIMPTTENGRTYTLKFVNNYLLRGIMKVLEQNGFISDFLNKEKNK
jgi:hypothetical protein